MIEWKQGISKLLPGHSSDNNIKSIRIENTQNQIQYYQENKVNIKASYQNNICFDHLILNKCKQVL